MFYGVVVVVKIFRIGLWDVWEGVCPIKHNGVLIHLVMRVPIYLNYYISENP